MASLKEKSISLLVSAAGVDVNNGTKQSIYVCPTGKSCVISSIVVRNLSIACTTNSVSFGWDTNATTTIADATHASFSATTVYTELAAKAGATVGTSGQIFGVKCNTTATAATATIDVYGYLF